jgi:hypothetical protein
LGKARFPSWACSAPGNTGDIIYVDFDLFKVYRKPIRIETSKDFQFGTDQVALRYCDRMTAFNQMRSAVTGAFGTPTYSNIVTRSTVTAS